MRPFALYPEDHATLRALAAVVADAPETARVLAFAGAVRGSLDGGPQTRTDLLTQATTIAPDMTSDATVELQDLVVAILEDEQLGVDAGLEGYAEEAA